MTFTIRKIHLAIAILAVAVLAPATAFATHVFDDVPDAAFYADAVEWAADKNITQGTTPTTFDPEAPVTRGQMVTFLKRYDDNVTQPAAAAATGVPGLEIVQGNNVVLDAAEIDSSTATCPAGKLLVGGGHSTTDGVPNIDVFRSWPSADDTWTATGKHVAGSNGRQFRAWAICATPAP